MANNSDRELVAGYLKGDQTALELLIKRHLKPIYNFTYKYVGNTQDAEDTVQETFVKAWRNLKKFDQNKKFKTWIFAIAKNTAIDFIKKKKAIPISKFDAQDGGNFLIDALADPSPLPYELLEKAGMAHILNSAIEKLSPACRAVLSLRYSNDFTFKEIAESLNEPLNTVKSRYRRGLSILKKVIGYSADNE
jgi:RNA polymerase sigma-70 factor, ECF subfamily